MLPKVILHNAVSVDGRMDNIEPDLGQFYGLAQRWEEDATIVGSETILKEEDIPEETEEDLLPPEKKPNDMRPLLAIPDSKGRVRSWHHLRKAPFWSYMVALISKTTPREYIDYLERRHIDYIIAGEEKVDMRTALEELKTRYNVKTARVDSGGSLNGVLLREGLVNEVSIMVLPSLVGGTSLHYIFQAPDLTSKEAALELKLAHFERLDEDVLWLRYMVKKVKQAALK